MCVMVWKRRRVFGDGKWQLKDQNIYLELNSILDIEFFDIDYAIKIYSYLMKYDFVF